MRRTLCALALLAGIAPSAHATWSILLINTRTGEVALGSATCLTNFDLQVGTPVLIPGVGAATAQSFVDQGGFNRVFIRDRLLEGVEPGDIIDLLEDFDAGHQTRQYGILDTQGGRATFTGDRAGAWAGGLTGQIGEVVYAVQGNVLTGEPVVTETVSTIITSLDAGLDLPETLMLAMDEARAFGGDGRCSCENNDPDGCGSPPDGWDQDTGKSAHIAYMLIARTGDGLGCNTVYRVGNVAWGVATGDFDNDGWPDVAVSAQGKSTIEILRNTALSPSLVTLATPRSIPVTGKPSGIGVADVDKDGNLDIAYADQSSNLVGIIFGDGEGAFTFPDFDFVPEGPTWIALGDLNNDTWPDLAVTSLDAGVVTILLNDGSGDLLPGQQITAGAEPWNIVAAELDSTPGLDLALTDRSANRAILLTNDGSGNFSFWQQLTTGARPLSITAGDFDGDGRTDLATANQTGDSISIFRQTAPGVFLTTTIEGVNNTTTIEAADINSDGLDDLVATASQPGRLTLLLGQAGADPALEGIYADGTQTNDLLLADLTGDGFPDALHNMRQARGIMAVAGVDPAAGNGFFNDGEGCATADYFMEFNIAFQTRDAPDPVDQLLDLFGPWRTSLLGLPDAIRSLATLETDRLPVGSTTQLVIEPRDWQPAPLGPGLTVWALHADDSAGLTTLGEALDLGDGTYTVEISAADLPPETRGRDTIEVHIRQADRTIILMPTLGITITGSLADWNGDGVVDTADLNAFLADWTARESPTDLTNDGTIDTRDVILFLRAWAGA